MQNEDLASSRHMPVFHLASMSGKTYQHFIWWASECREHIYTLGREIPLGLCSLTVAIRPPSTHDIITIIVFKNNQITFTETQEC